MHWAVPVPNPTVTYAEQSGCVQRYPGKGGSCRTYCVLAQTVSYWSRQQYKNRKYWQYQQLTIVTRQTTFPRSASPLGSVWERRFYTHSMQKSNMIITVYAEKFVYYQFRVPTYIYSTWLRMYQRTQHSTCMIFTLSNLINITQIRQRNMTGATHDNIPTYIEDKELYTLAATGSEWLWIVDFHGASTIRDK